MPPCISAVRIVPYPSTTCLLTNVQEAKCHHNATSHASHLSADPSHHLSPDIRTRFEATPAPRGEQITVDPQAQLGYFDSGKWVPGWRWKHTDSEHCARDDGLLFYFPKKSAEKHLGADKNHTVGNGLVQRLTVLKSYVISPSNTTNSESRSIDSQPCTPFCE